MKHIPILLLLFWSGWFNTCQPQFSFECIEDNTTKETSAPRPCMYGIFANEHAQFNNLARQRTYHCHPCKHKVLRRYSNEFLYTPSRDSIFALQNLLNDYKTDLPADATRTARIHARENTLQKSINDVSITRNYRISDNAQKLLIDNKHNPLFLSECVGTELQQHLHKELVDIVNHAAELSGHPAIDKAPIAVGTIVDLAQVSSELNQQGEVAKGFAVADLGWAMIDFSKGVLEGAALGGKIVIQDLWDHPIEATATIVASEYVLTYQLCRVLHEVGKVSIQGTINNIVTMFDQQKGVERWVASVEPTMQTIDTLTKKEWSLRDGVRGTTAFVVSWKTQSKLLGGLNKFYSGAKAKALAFAKKNPLATPEYYMKTPEGMVFRAVSDPITAKSGINTSAWSRANRMSEFLEWEKKGLTINKTHFTITDHFMNSLNKSGRKDIMPNDIINALSQKPINGDAAFTWKYIDPHKNVRVFVNEFNQLVGVQPGNFK